MYFCQVKERTSITNPLLQKMLVTLQQVGGLPALQKLTTWSSLVTEDFHQQLLRNSVGRKHPSSMEIELQQLRRLSHVQANATSTISNQLTTLLTFLNEAYKTDPSPPDISVLSTPTKKTTTKNKSTPQAITPPSQNINTTLQLPLATDSGSNVKTLEDLFLFWRSSKKIVKLFKDERWIDLNTSGRPTSISDRKNFAKFNHLIAFLKRTKEKYPSPEWNQMFDDNTACIDAKRIAGKLSGVFLDYLKSFDKKNGKNYIIGLGSRISSLKK